MCWYSATTRPVFPSSPHRLPAGQRPGGRRPGDRAALRLATRTSRHPPRLRLREAAPAAGSRAQGRRQAGPGRLRLPRPLHRTRRGKHLAQRALGATAPTSSWPRASDQPLLCSGHSSTSPPTRVRTGTSCGCSTRSTTKASSPRCWKSPSPTSARSPSPPAGRGPGRGQPARSSIRATATASAPPWDQPGARHCNTPNPRILGSQSAVVTGPRAKKSTATNTAGESAVPLGPRGQADDSTSCWLRVSSSWAGDRYRRHRHPAHRHGSAGHLPRRRPRPAAGHRLPVPQNMWSPRPASEQDPHGIPRP